MAEMILEFFSAVKKARLDRAGRHIQVIGNFGDGMSLQIMHSYDGTVLLADTIQRILNPMTLFVA